MSNKDNTKENKKDNKQNKSEEINQKVNQGNSVKSSLQVVMFVIICLLINYYGKKFAIAASLPLWLDAIGTAIASYALGPACGALVGMSVNIIYAMEDPTLLFYLVTSIAISVVIGISARKNMFETKFKASTVAVFLTLVATVTSTPVNCILNNGYIGNVWGDGFFEMLKEWGVHWILASAIGQILLEFVDKIITLAILYAIIKSKKKWFMKYTKVSLTTILIFAMLLNVFTVSGNVAFAANDEEEPDYNEYIQTVYSNNNGLLSGEANDIVMTNDGLLWIATYAGLYRYNGSTFSYMNQLDTVKNANDLYVDVEGRLWIGTNDDGVSLLINGEIINTLDETTGLPTNSVRSMVQQSSGKYFIGTSDELAIVSISGGIRIVGTVREIVYAKSLTADNDNHVVAVTLDGELFLVDDMSVVDSKVAPSDEVYFTSCAFGSDDILYVGTENGNIYKYKVKDNKLDYQGKIGMNEIGAINSLYETKPGEMFACGENGIACMRGEDISYVSVGSFNSSIERMTMDYQGNLWFSSSRLGIMKMCKTAFSELYQESGLDETVVNTITKWNGNFYFGTDSGLDIVKEGSLTVINNSLTEYLNDVRIRSLMVDSKNRLWICTYGKGAICVNANGAMEIYDQSKGIEGNRFRHALELSDGSIAISNDKGVAFVKDGQVIHTIGVADGLTNSVVLCLYEMKDGSVLAGTDGGGICVINNGRITNILNKDDGLGSEVILRISEDKDAGGVFVTTSNGVAYIDDKYRATNLSNIPYSNNYDVYDMGDGRIMIPGSAGIYIIAKEQLLSGGEVNYELLNYMAGLRGSLTANAWNYVDGTDEFYFANGSGVTKLKLSDYESSTSSYRMLISNISIDDSTYWVDRNEEIYIPREAKEVVLYPEIVNYSANDPGVRYYMQGVDKEAITVRQSELSAISYLGLKSGTYKFVIAIIEEDRVVEEQTYTFIKEKKIYDNTWFKLYFFAEIILIVAWFSWFITRKTVSRTLELQKQEIEMAKKQIDMGNETILAIAKTVDAKDENTSQHSIRVSEYSLMIAKRLGYSEEDCENLRKAALLHDIGKIGIPDSVLNKPGRLTDEEYAIMKSHVIRGGEILKDFTLIPNVQIGAMYHHERYDGKGYMHGLKGEEIPEWARIIGIADAFDAMTANRVYRKQLDFDFVIEEIKKGRGTQFDPRFADIMLQLIEDGEIDVNELYKKKSVEDEM